MTEIMKRPPDYEQYGYGLKDCYVEIRKGDFILADFYDQGYWHENNIPKELEDKSWRPDPDKTYKFWWYSTNPSDPSDPGENILKYIEEWNIWMDTPELRQEVIDKLFKLSPHSLLKLNKYIDKL